LNRLEERAYSDEIGRLLPRPMCILPWLYLKMQPFRGREHLRPRQPRNLLRPDWTTLI